MGTGPFTFVEHVKGSHWIGKKNPNYWDKGKPYLDSYRAVFIKTTRRRRWRPCARERAQSSSAASRRPSATPSWARSGTRSGAGESWDLLQRRRSSTTSGSRGTTSVSGAR
jgi:ABC-type transport system substrate-binding protein